MMVFKFRGSGCPKARKNGVPVYHVAPIGDVDSCQKVDCTFFSLYKSMKYISYIPSGNKVGIIIFVWHDRIAGKNAE